MPPATVHDASLSLHITKSDMAFLSKIGSETTGERGTVKCLLLCSLSRNTWKHNRTEFRSILDGWDRWANPAKMKKKKKKIYVLAIVDVWVFLSAKVYNV